MNLDVNKFNFNFECSNPELIRYLSGLQVDFQHNSALRVSKDEYIHLKPYLIDLKPKKVLDIGCGIGRSSVFFKNFFGWEDTIFYLADFNELVYCADKNFVPCGKHSNAEPIPYNNLSITEEFCKNNNLTNFELIDISKDKMENLQDINLVYSFHCIGYHWDLEKAIEKYSLEKITTEDCLMIIGGRREETGINLLPKTIGKFDRFHSISGKEKQAFHLYSKI